MVSSQPFPLKYRSAYPMKVLDLHVDADPNLHNGRPVLLLLHGFTQNARSWDSVREGLRQVGPTVAVDLIGHGTSPKPEDVSCYTMPSCVAQLERVLDRVGVERAWIVGYSMGGRASLHFAVAKPERTQGMVLASTSPGLQDLATRQERMKADAALADRIPGWGVEAFMNYWFDLELFQGFKRLPQSRQRALREERLNNSPVGLANSLRGMGTGAMLPLWPRLGDMNLPALVMAGELDEKFSQIARHMATDLPDASLSIVPDTGHAIHLESPQRFITTVVDFFTRLQRYQ